jgi:hypothetical protein
MRNRKMETRKLVILMEGDYSLTVGNKVVGIGCQLFTKAQVKKMIPFIDKYHASMTPHYLHLSRNRMLAVRDDTVSIQARHKVGEGWYTQASRYWSQVMSDENDVCLCVDWFRSGYMTGVTTTVKHPQTKRGCAPRSGLVGYAIGELHLNSREATAPLNLALDLSKMRSMQYDGNDFYVGYKVIESTPLMVLLPDRTCLVEVAS